MSDFSKFSEKLLGAGLPLLGGIFGGPAGAAVGSGVASLLGIDEKHLNTAILNKDDIDKLKKYTLDHQLELEKLQIAFATSQYQEDTKRLASVNKTIQTEVISNDPFVARARPTIIYIIGACLLLYVGTICTSAFVSTLALQNLVSSLPSLAQVFSIGLGIIGVHTVSRSWEKKTAIEKGNGNG